jgi:hypothetical protein
MSASGDSETLEPAFPVGAFSTPRRVRPPPTDAPLAALIADSRTAPTHIDLLSLTEGDSSRTSDHLHEPRTEPRTH